MPRTKGATSWKVQEVKKVMRSTRNKKKLSPNDPDVVELCNELGRSYRAIVHVRSEVRKGTIKLLDTDEGRKHLSEYVEGFKKRTIADRIKDAVKTFKTNESVIPLSTHKKLMDQRVKSLKNESSDMVVLAHRWGYNQGVADFRGKFLESTTALNKEIPDVNNEVVTQTSKILFNNG